MLVLTRRPGDSIVIGHDIVVTVLEVRSDQVRIGIDAPREIAVHREEVYRQMVAENSAAVASADAGAVGGGIDRAEALRRRLRQARPRAGQGGQPPTPSGE